MRNVTCAQCYRKRDMKHLRSFIRNVTLDMCTGLPELCHEAFVQCY